MFLTYPFDIIRARLAYHLLLHRDFSFWPTIKAISNEHRFSFAGFYKGFMPSLYGIVPYAGISFYCYDRMKRLLGEGSFAKFFSGCIAGAAGQTAAYPLDVVRRRMQLSSVAVHLPRYKNTAHALVQILKNEGLRGLFLGISINYIKVAPATGVSFVVYESLKRCFEIN